MARAVLTSTEPHSPNRVHLTAQDSGKLTRAAAPAQSWLSYLGRPLETGTSAPSGGCNSSADLPPGQLVLRQPLTDKAALFLFKKGMEQNRQK